MLPVTLALEGLPSIPFAGGAWVKIGYLGVVATALAYAAYFRGLHEVEASRGAMFFFLKPFLPSVFAWLVLGERITAQIVAGAVVVLAALVLGLRTEPRLAREACAPNGSSGPCPNPRSGRNAR